jgi:ribosomal protein S18 acetylase RimI-like enzyme
LLLLTTIRAPAFVEALRTDRFDLNEYKMTLDKPILPAAFGTELVFRRARPAEKVILQQLMIKIFFGMTEENVAGWYENVEAPDARYYVVLLDDAYVGKVDVCMDEHEALIYNFGIAPEYRRRGFGRQLLARTTQDLQAMGHRRITLEVETRNEHALALYRSCGFQESSKYDYYALDITE